MGMVIVLIASLNAWLTEVTIRLKVNMYSTLFRNWAVMAAGQSYWHCKQGVGTEFVPGTLAGYFNDLTAKTMWKGPTDPSGLPLSLVNGQPQYFPTTILQKGLGHWDRWLRTGRSNSVEYQEFAKVARWARTGQDERGGWPLPMCEPEATCPYSAMIQGQGASVLCRAYVVTGCQEYLSAATRAAGLLLTSIREGGTSRTSSEGIVLEENPTEPASTVLNGWAFALFGLYDLELVSPDRHLASALLSSARALAHLLPSFDSGYWSYYDSRGTVSSPFYHRLHIAQLQAMKSAFPEQWTVFSFFADQFGRYLERRGNRVRAVLTKSLQKVMHPPSVIVAQS